MRETPNKNANTERQRWRKGMCEDERATRAMMWMQRKRTERQQPKKEFYLPETPVVSSPTEKDRKVLFTFQQMGHIRFLGCGACGALKWRPRSERRSHSPQNGLSDN